MNPYEWDEEKFSRIIQVAWTRSENIEDEELASFYHTLMISEANHYTMFITLARKYFDREKVDEMWKGLLAFEAEVISKLGNTERIHG